MRLLTALLGLTVLAWPQQAQPPEAYPDMFLTVGTMYASKATPHYSAWLAGGKLLGKSAGTYSFSGMYVTTSKAGKLTTSTTTGVAQHMRSIPGGFDLYGIGAAGVAASSSGTATTFGAALNSGLFAVRPLRDGYSLNIFAQAIGAGGATSVVVGIGFGWGK